MGPAIVQNSLNSMPILSCAEMSMKGAMIVYISSQSAPRQESSDILTAIAVAGKKIIVKREMLFKAEESRFVSRAICCCIRLYSFLCQYRARHGVR